MTWIDALAQWLRLDPATVVALLQSLAVVVTITLVRVIAVRVARQRIEDTGKLYRFRRALNYTAGAIALLLIGRIWFTGLHDLGVLLGLAAAGLAIALKEPLLALAGWVYILVRRPYTVGDRIQVGRIIGDVIDVRMFQTYLMECGNWVDGDQSTGRIALLPNAAVFLEPVINFTLGFEPIWDELPVTLTFESDWRKAKVILTRIADEQAAPYCEEAQRQLRRTAGEHLIFYGKLTPIVYTTVMEHGVRLTLRYLTPPRKRRGNAERIWESILDAFAAEPGIQFAYPTTRFFEQPREGKPALREGFVVRSDGSAAQDR